MWRIMDDGKKILLTELITCLVKERPCPCSPKKEIIIIIKR